MKLFKNVFILILTLVSPLVFAITYIVKKGDTLSEIAHKNYSGSVYGKNGSLQKLLNLNPHIKDKNFIKIGKLINLGDFENERGLASEQVNITVAEKPNVIPPVIESKIENKPQEKISNNKNYLSTVTIAPIVFFTRIDSTDIATNAKALLISNINYGVKFNWEQNWSDDTSTYQELKTAQLSFTDNLTSSTIIENKNVSVSGIGIGANFNRTNSISWGAKVNYGQEIYARGKSSSNSVILDSVSVPAASIYARFKLANRGPFALSADLEAKSLLAAETSNYTTSTGTGYVGKLGFSQDKEKYKMGCDLFYKQQQQDSSIMQAIRKDIGLELYFRW